MKYRPEIDGLRALAVIPVILFHAGFELFSGGFVGVDIFFVISGYLITTIILKGKEQGVFSLISFYENRIRRIIPPLFLVMLVSLLFAYWYFLPNDFKDFSKSLVATAIFSSNVLFFHETGYWDALSETKPLLHIWSLAIEEQFYLIYPLLLMFILKFKKLNIIFVLVVIMILSITLAQWGAYAKPTANFFLLPSRIWELAVGCILAIYLFNHNDIEDKILGGVLINIVGIFGVLMIIFAIFTFDKNTPFPSIYTLIPILGASLIILFASPKTFVGKLLANRLMVGIGLISYSVYLWHQPLFAFTRYIINPEPSKLFFIGLIVLAFLLGYLSYQYVEKPFRKKVNPIKSKTVFSLFIIGSLIFVSIGLFGYYKEDFRNRMTKSGISFQKIQKKVNRNYGLNRDCNIDTDICRTSKKPKILVWGDSFAGQLVNGIIASQPDVKLIQVTKPRCGSFFDIAVYFKNELINKAEQCLQFIDEVRTFIKKNDTIRYVVLSAYFYDYLNKENSLLYRDGKIVEANLSSAVKEFTKTLEELKAHNIIPIIFSAAPRTGRDIARCLVRMITNSNVQNCNFHLSEVSKQYKAERKFLKTISKNYKVVFLEEFICQNSMCKVSFDDIFIYRDATHISVQGSILLGKEYNFYKIITK